MLVFNANFVSKLLLSSGVHEDKFACSSFIICEH